MTSDRAARSRTAWKLLVSAPANGSRPVPPYHGRHTSNFWLTNAVATLTSALSLKVPGFVGGASLCLSSGYSFDAGTWRCLVPYVLGMGSWGNPCARICEPASITKPRRVGGRVDLRIRSLLILGIAMGQLFAAGSWGEDATPERLLEGRHYKR